MPAPPSVKMRGYEGQLYYTPSGGAETLYANVSDIEIDIKADQIDFSDHSTQGWKDLEGGLKTWTGTVKAMALQLGADENAFFDALVSGAAMSISFRPQDVTSGVAYTGSCSVIGYKAASPNSGAQTIDISLSGIGALTRGVVATSGT